MKYELEFIQKETYIFDIEADSEEEAINKAIEIYDSDKKQDYYFDSDTSIEISPIKGD